ADLIVTPTPLAARRIYVRPSQAFSLRAVVQNIGNARADGPFNVAVYRSNDATVDASDTQIDTYALASLNSHASNTADRALTAPAASGTYYLAVLADDTNVVNESSEVNNSGSVITLVVGEPDLQVHFGAFTLPTMLVPGDRLSVPLVITNAGTIPAAGTLTNDIYASIGLTPNPGDQLLASVTRAVNLAPGASVTVSVSVSITDALPLATWHILADVDTTNAVLESDETNNTVATAATFDQVWRFGTFGSRRGVKLAVHDGGGTLVTFTASGPGWGGVNLVAPGFNVTMTDSTASTSVKVATDGPATGLNDVTIPGSFGTLNAKAALNGTLDVAGSIASIALGDLTDALIDLHTNGGIVIDPGTRVALSLGALSNSVIDAGDEPIRSLKALEWLDAGGPADTLSAPSIGSVAIRGQRATSSLPFLSGDFEPNLTTPGTIGAATIAGTLRNTWAALSVSSLKAANLTAATLTLSQTVDPKLLALGKLTVTQWMTDSRLLAAGNIGPVTLAGVTGSDIFASVAPQPHGLPDPTTDILPLPHARIKSVTVTGKVVDGLGHSTIDSNFAAYSLGAFNLANALATNIPPTPWGLAAHSLDSYKYHEIGLTYTWQPALDPVPTVPGGDFQVSLA
ncbi:MAG: CARDB domain-containing protein, partial [Planctomycetota bacterium]